MRVSLIVAIVAIVGGTAGAAFAQSAGDDGLPVYSANGSWQCNKIRFPKGAGSAKALITGTATVCSGGTCSNAGGDADLYLYATTASSTTKPSSRASGYTCRPYLAGNNESCNVTVSTSADSYFWGCVYNASTYNTVQLRAEYTMSNGTSAAALGGTYYIDYWKNNLFLGIAYHRFGCMTNDVKIVNDLDYDGFSDHDYCRYNYGLTDPATRGGESSYMSSVQFTNWTFTQVKSRLDTCGSNTNSTYNTPNYARRSGSCSYNIITNCNSDCWIKNFSTCVHQAIPIASPCW